MNILITCKGEPVLVDDNIYDEKSDFKYNQMKSGYIYRSVWDPVLKKSTKVLLHREIMGCRPKDGLEVDHIDHIKQNCLSSNLRVVTPSQNCHNQPPRSARLASNKFKGVSLSKNKKYRARITVNKKEIILGYFKTPVSAAIAYDEAAVKYFGEYACLNFPLAD